MIQVLIAEDSTVARDLLTHIINSQPDMEVIGTALMALMPSKPLNI